MSSNWNQNTNKLLALKKKKFKSKPATPSLQAPESNATQRVSIDLYPSDQNVQGANEALAKNRGGAIGKFENIQNGQKMDSIKPGDLSQDNDMNFYNDHPHGINNQQIFEYNNDHSAKNAVMAGLSPGLELLDAKKERNILIQNEKNDKGKDKNTADEELSEIMNSKQSQGELLINEFLDEDYEDN